MLNPAFLLLIVLLTAGYIAIARTVCMSAPSPHLIPAIAAVTLFLYLCGVCFVALIYIFYSYDFYVLWGTLLIFSILSLLFLAYRCAKHPHELNQFFLLMFLVYCGLIAAVTLYGRMGTFSKGIQMIPFQRVQLALSKGDYSIMEHDILNALMFIPVGILIPLINRRLFQHLSYAFLFGIVTSTLIETTQMLAHLGVFDIDDIIANVCGTVGGYLFSVLFLCIFQSKNRKK